MIARILPKNDSNLYNNDTLTMDTLQTMDDCTCKMTPLCWRELKQKKLILYFERPAMKLVSN